MPSTLLEALWMLQTAPPPHRNRRNQVKYCWASIWHSEIWAVLQTDRQTDIHDPPRSTKGLQEPLPWRNNSAWAGGTHWCVWDTTGVFVWMPPPLSTPPCLMPALFQPLHRSLPGPVCHECGKGLPHHSSLGRDSTSKQAATLGCFSTFIIWQISCSLPLQAPLCFAATISFPSDGWFSRVCISPCASS